MNKDFNEFTSRFRLLAKKNPGIVENTLSNIFTMRLIGNKTHGDLAEIGIAEFINQFMYDYRSRHVGKDLFRAKEHEEDIVVIPELRQDTEIPVSLKAYGDGPLQLSTDKESILFSHLEMLAIPDMTDAEQIRSVFRADAFHEFGKINVLPLIYDEKKKICCIVTYDFGKAIRDTARIVRVEAHCTLDKSTGKVVPAKGRIHPVYLFLNARNGYICEVRYGGKSANALQRGLWTNTKTARPYFSNLTGWINYENNMKLVELIGLALNSTAEAHAAAGEILLESIQKLRNHEE